MYKNDYLTLDGHLLRLFVLVHETGSVSRAAENLGINQSSVSHALERLRRIVGDPLFVRSGRGIAPTVRADALLDQARSLLAGLEQFTESESYDPSVDQNALVIAANDYEVETIVRPLLRVLQQDAPRVTLHVLRAYGRGEWAALLRDKGADLVLAPTLQGNESDLVQQTLLEDRHICFFDPKLRTPPDNLDAYCAAPHAVMLPGRFQLTEVDRLLQAEGRKRHIAVAAPSFATLATLISGTDIVATMPSRLGDTIFAGFESVAPPVDTAPFSIAQIWHTRNSASPRHRWLREKVRRCLL